MTKRRTRLEEGDEERGKGGGVYSILLAVCKCKNRQGYHKHALWQMGVRTLYSRNAKTEMGKEICGFSCRGVKVHQFRNSCSTAPRVGSSECHMQVELLAVTLHFLCRNKKNCEVVVPKPPRSHVEAQPTSCTGRNRKCVIGSLLPPPMLSYVTAEGTLI